MALNPKLTNAAANASADAACALVNTGYLRIYDGTQPTTADTAIGSQVLLAELRFGSAAFGAAVGGVATANAITADSDNDNTGTATWFRALKSDGSSPVFDGSVGVSGCDLNLSTTSLVQHGTTSISSFTYTQPKG